MALVRVKDALAERKAAWDAYIVETQRIPEYEYDEREVFAWRRLRKRLREIEESECR